MTKPGMTRPVHDDWTAFELAVETLDDIRSRLKAGGAVTLTEEEAELVLANLVTPRAPNCRPSPGNERIFAALYCLRLERDGMTAKDAIAAAAAKFGYSKWTMRAARREVLKK